MTLTELAYKEWLMWDLKALKETREQIAYFKQLAHSYLGNKAIHDKALLVVEALDEEEKRLLRAIDHDRAQLNQSNTQSREPVRFRMEENKGQNGGA